jgi:D-alanine-D-alanine ligase
VKVALLEGGRSLERAVSLRSGQRVAEALAELGHEVLELDLDADLVPMLEREGPDAVFIALHGIEGEDGTIQSLLDLMEIPYTGPRSLACRRCMDKDRSKQLFREHGVPTPDWVTYSAASIRELGAAATFKHSAERLGLPLVVKPDSQGSSLGVRIVTESGMLPDAVVSAFSYDDRVLLESWVNGRELAISILDDEPLPVVEAIPADGNAYDFEARYEIGGARFVCPAELDEAGEQAVRGAALGAYRALGCSGFARVDLMLGGEGPSVLEVNAIPGLTETSLMPQAAEAAGIGFTDMVARILELAH